MGGRRVAKEIKDEVLRKIRSGRAVKDVAEEYGLKTSCIYNWLGDEPKVGDRSETLELSRLKRENEALLKLLGRLTYESELRKKK